jgi:hypothetical protein
MLDLQLFSSPSAIQSFFPCFSTSHLYILAQHEFSYTPQRLNFLLHFSRRVLSIHVFYNCFCALHLLNLYFIVVSLQFSFCSYASNAFVLFHSLFRR